MSSRPKGFPGTSVPSKPLHQVAAAMKVKAYSERKGQPEGDQDKKDVQGLVCVGSTSPEAIREILKRHRPDLASNLDKILL